MRGQRIIAESVKKPRTSRNSVRLGINYSCSIAEVRDNTPHRDPTPADLCFSSRLICVSTNQDFCFFSFVNHNENYLTLLHITFAEVNLVHVI
jgi:hypothetical protein